MRYFSNLTRVQNMGWDLNILPFLEIWTKNYQKLG